MVSGHSNIDYVVVLSSVFYSIYSLSTKPKRLLLFLPTLLSVYFFIPLGSMLTPERLVSLTLVAWVAWRSKSTVDQRAACLSIFALVLVWVSTFVALSIGDSGTRPLFRALYYTGMIASFLFVLGQVQTNEDLRRLMFGFAIAGMIHGGYSIYQLLAFRMGLPFRGIARESVAQVALAGEGFRINGLASEPKRLGFLLFAGAMGAYATAIRAQSKHRVYWILGATITILVSLLTYSASYYIALALSIPVILLFFPRVVWHFLRASSLLLIIVFMVPSIRDQFVDNLNIMFESRQDEVEQGIDGRVVYRQEMYARDFLSHAPLTVLSGVGMGRYNTVFLHRYGYGAGFGDDDTLTPLNSQFLETLFDLGILGPCIIYLSIMALICRILSQRRDEISLIWTFMLLLLAIQSFFVQSLSILMIAAAGSLAYLRIRSKERSKVMNKNCAGLRLG